MFLNIRVLLVACLCLVKLTISAKILINLPIPSLSHHIFYRQIIRALASRGHEIVVISADPMNDLNLSNVTEIDVHEITYNALSATKWLEDTQRAPKSQVAVLRELLPKFKKMADEVLTSPKIKQLIGNHNQHFDLLINEAYFLTSQFYAFREHFNCPAIGLCSAGTSPDTMDAVGNSPDPNYFASPLMVSGSNLSFWERLELVWHSIDFRIFYHFEFLPMANDQVQKYFNTKSNVWYLQKSMDLVLENSSPLFYLPRPLVPNWIQIGGLHEHQVESLPQVLNSNCLCRTAMFKRDCDFQDLQNFLDNSKQGVVYFSLGSNVKSENLPLEIRESIIRAFEQLPYNILWKWENKNLDNKPKNVFIKQWVPQASVLAHTNLKAFVTQGGLQSIDEAIRSKVPIVGIPFGGDQQFNVYRVKELGIGKQLKVKDITTKSLFEIISEVAGNTKYKIQMSKLSDLYWDQPTKPLDRAIWWIEYVIRHKGAKQLRCSAADLPWHKYLLLDILGFILGVVLLLVLTFVFSLRIICRMIFKKLKLKSE